MSMSVSVRDQVPRLESRFSYVDVGAREIRFSYPDLYEFMRDSNIYRMMIRFKQKIGYVRGEPALLFKGVVTPWSEIKRELFPDGVVGKAIPKGYIYTEFDGFKQQNQAKWTKLTPMHWDRSDPREGHYLELCTQAKVAHAYVNIIENGKVYQVGFCGNFKKGGFPFRNISGVLMSPDPKDFVHSRIVRTRIKITADQFQRLKQKIEKDQNEQNLFFNIRSRNCTAYALELLEEIGININNEEYDLQILGRVIFQAINVRPSPTCLKVLHVIVQGFRYIVMPFYAIYLIAGGMNRSGPKVSKLPPKHVEKHFPTLRKIFSVNMMKIKSGWSLRNWQRWVEISRQITITNIMEERDRELRENGGSLSNEREQAIIDSLVDVAYAVPKVDQETFLRRPGLLVAGHVVT